MPASSAPLASATLAGSESEPKLMSDTMSGIFSRSGFCAFGPTTTSVPTGTSSSCGGVASCAVRIWMSSHDGSSLRGTPIASTTPWWPVLLSPSLAYFWISLTCGSIGSSCTSA